jgi:hypothetical protein
VNGPASTFPVGLLGLLGIKNNGKYPADLATTYVPTFDMLDWFTRSNALELISGQTGVITNVGEKAEATGKWLVPAGQAWLLKGAAAVASIPDEATIYATLCIAQRSGNALYSHTAGANIGQVWQNTADAGRWYLNGPVLMIPGDELVLCVHNINVGTTDFNPYLNGLVLKFQL